MKETFGEKLKRSVQKPVSSKKRGKRGFAIPEGLSRQEKIEWEIDNRMSGGSPQLDLTLSKLFDISEKLKRVAPPPSAEGLSHPNNNKEPQR